MIGLIKILVNKNTSICLRNENLGVVSFANNQQSIQYTYAFIWLLVANTSSLFGLLFSSFAGLLSDHGTINIFWMPICYALHVGSRMKDELKLATTYISYSGFTSIFSTIIL